MMRRALVLAAFLLAVGSGPLAAAAPVPAPDPPDRRPAKEARPREPATGPAAREPVHHTAPVVPAASPDPGSSSQSPSLPAAARVRTAVPRWQDDGGSAGAEERRGQAARPRAPREPAARTPERAQPRRDPAVERARVPTAAPAAEVERPDRARDRQYSRSRMGRPPTGVAVPRPPGSAWGGVPWTSRVYYRPGYWTWVPWGWGAGYWLYYDPFWWGAGVPYYGGYGYGYGVGYAGPFEELGSVRLKVKPRHAQVFVDGGYVGVVDEFDGVFQKLRLEVGPHKIEIRAEGYEPLTFDVYASPGHTVVLSGELQRLP